MGVIRLARRWEARLKIKKRLQRGEPWIRLPDPPEAPPADDENASDDEGPKGPPINMQFLNFNVAIMYEMIDAWGLTPKPSVHKIEKEVGVDKFVLR